LVKDGKFVAVKKLVQDKRYKSRELQIHKEMYHMNIVRVFHAYFTQNSGQTLLNIVMDFIPTSVFRIQKEFEKLG
jgi:serine/threonine protein kinase